MSESTNGKLVLVSQGPGPLEHMTRAAQEAITNSTHVICYRGYADLCQELLKKKVLHLYRLGEERDRAKAAIELASSGENVALISSGDIGIYAMAAVVFEELYQSSDKDQKPEVIVLPGVTAATACASLLGAPLSNDFATLSLSDLLTPWSDILRRAEMLAEADMVVALYNVQSEKRQKQFYRIVDVFLNRRDPETFCGIVRNAYRPGQEVAIVKLKELSSRKLDMFTTVIIGNSKTCYFNNKIFTERGYLSRSKDPANPGLSAENLTQNSIWIFSGTSDGNALVEAVVKAGQPAVVSVATEYGASQARAKLPNTPIVAGKLGEEGRTKLLKEHKAKAIVDATHPYATNIRTQLLSISHKLRIPLIRFARPQSGSSNYELATTVESCVEAAQQAGRIGKRIFLATGSKELLKFLNHSRKPEAANIDWFIRVAPDSFVLEELKRFNFPSKNICAMQGPFSKELNIALWQSWQIDCVVTRDSGVAGGFVEKLEAARELGLPIIVINRPELTETDQAYSFTSENLHSVVDHILTMETIK